MAHASPPPFPLRAVAALFLDRQHLDRPRCHRLTDRRLVRFASDAGGIQIDSINVIDRAHYLSKTHRADHQIEVKLLHFEPWFVRGAQPPAANWGALDADRAFAGVAETLRSLATFVGADGLALGRVAPHRFTAPLRRALRAQP